MKYVNAYATTRHYGGPEEGGWWFNAGELLAAVPFPDDVAQDILDDERERLHEMFSDLAYGNPSSVRGGVRIETRVSEDQGADYPAERPYYE